jgi:hypothetical protein
MLDGTLIEGMTLAVLALALVLALLAELVLLLVFALVFAVVFGMISPAFLMEGWFPQEPMMIWS